MMSSSMPSDVAGQLDRPAFRISFITPCFNERDNLPVLHQRLLAVTELHKLDWEWIIIDDHSRDDTFAVASALAQADARIRVMRFSRNFGSHLATTCGLEFSSGDCAVVLAADLQDPPELVPSMLDQWRQGTQVVWAVRETHAREGRFDQMFSDLYYWLMRRMAGLKELPSKGADFFLLDRRVIDAFSRFDERNVSIFALITWMGFRQGVVHYDKQARLHGSSGWTFAKKLKLVVDSLTAFSYLPIRVMSVLGLLTAVSGFCYAATVLLRALAHDTPVPGWSSLMVVALILGGAQILMLGILGEYLWRALDESKKRPRYLIEAMSGNDAAPSAPAGREC